MGEGAPGFGDGALRVRLERVLVEISGLSSNPAQMKPWNIIVELGAGHHRQHTLRRALRD